MSPDDVEKKIWDSFEAMWKDQPLTDDPEEFRHWFVFLTRTHQVLFPTHWLCAEVYNGGFHQYFHNGTGLHAPEAIVGFRELGLNDVAEIVQRAVNVFGSEFPRERQKRMEFLDSIEGDEVSEWNPFFELDDLFYTVIEIPGAPALSDDDRFTVAAQEYIKISD